MNFIDHLEKKFPRFGIRDLMRYVIVVNLIGFFIIMVVPEIYYNYLSLDIDQVLHGQLWRLFTFLLFPAGSMGGGSRLMVIVVFGIWMYVYYSIGTSLERIWGTFRFTLFYLCGILFVVLVTFAAYFIINVGGFHIIDMLPQLDSYYLGTAPTLEYVNDSLFLAFALIFPEAQFLAFFVVPVKAKWLAAVWLLLDGYYVMDGIRSGLEGNYLGYIAVALIIGSLLNMVLFLIFGRGTPGLQGAYRQKKRRKKYKKKMQGTLSPDGTIHRCSICGRTEKDDPNLQFRYCSKCSGSHEYCSDHLYTHEHVQK